MATANLIVKIGADISSLDRATKSAVAKVQGLATNLQQVGSALSIGLAAPLAAFGAAALRSGGEIESLKLALSQLEGGAAGAERRFKELLKVAELPGLGIREVVQADLSLRNYGFSAERAKKITLEFGNALAAAGRGKEDLAEATRQLGQLAARGKVTQDNLKPIIERIPQAARIIAKEFGTLDTEVLQKAGISSERLINVLLEGLSTTGRVTGGIKNDFENLQQSIDIALSEAGKALAPFAKRFIDEFAVPMIGKTQELTDRFKSLPESYQTAIVGAGALAAGSGVALYAFGNLVQAATTLVTVLGKLPPALTAARYGLLGIGAAAATSDIFYLVDALFQWRSAETRLTEVQQQRKDVLASLEANLRRHGVDIQALSKQYSQGVISLADYEKALRKLAVANAPVVAGIKGQKDNLTGLAQATKEVAQKAQNWADISILHAVALERFNEAISKQKAGIKELQKEAEALFGAAAGEGDSILRLETALRSVSLAGGPLEGIFTSFGEASKQAFEFTEEQIKLATRASKDLVAEISKIPGETRLVEEAWARVGLQISQAIPKDLQDFRDRIVGDAKKTVEKGAKDFEKATKANEKAAEAMKRHIERYMHQTARAMTDVIFSAETIGQAFTKMGREILKSLATAVIEAQLKKLTKVLVNWGTSIANTGIGKVLGGLFGVDLAKGAGTSAVIKNATAPATEAATTAATNASNAGAGAALSAASGALGIVNAVSGVVSAVSSVISNFQLAGVNKSLDLIEHEVRYSQIHLLHILENSNKFWPWIQYSHDRLRQLVETGIAVYNAAGDQGLRIAPGSGGGTTINFDLRGATFGGGTTQEAVEEMLSTAARRLVLAGGIAG